MFIWTWGWGWETGFIKSKFRVGCGCGWTGFCINPKFKPGWEGTGWTCGTEESIKSNMSPPDLTGYFLTGSEIRSISNIFYCFFDGCFSTFFAGCYSKSRKSICLLFYFFTCSVLTGEMTLGLLPELLVELWVFFTTLYLSASETSSVRING